MNPDWLVAAGLTLAGSVHCVGMCGGFVLAVAAGGQRVPRALLLDQLLLQLGKASSYALLGALAGAFGAALISSPAWSWAGRVLAVLAGLSIAAVGLTLLGLRARQAGGLTNWLAGLWGRLVGPLLSARPTGFPLVVGMAVGLLPCPLVYAGLAAAAASASPARGAAILAGVALGTIPALTFVALSGALVGPVARRRLAWAAGVGLLLVGAVTAARGLAPGLLHAGHAGHAGHETSAPAGAPATPCH